MPSHRSKSTLPLLTPHEQLIHVSISLEQLKADIYRHVLLTNKLDAPYFTSIHPNFNNDSVNHLIALVDQLVDDHKELHDISIPMKDQILELSRVVFAIDAFSELQAFIETMQIIRATTLSRHVVEELESLSKSSLHELDTQVMSILVDKTERMVVFIKDQLNNYLRQAFRFQYESRPSSQLQTLLITFELTPCSPPIPIENHCQNDKLQMLDDDPFLHLTADPISISDLFDALYDCLDLERAVNRLMDQIIDHLISPILQTPNHLFSVQYSTVSSRYSTITLHIDPHDHSKDTAPPWQMGLKVLIKIGDCIHDILHSNMAYGTHFEQTMAVFETAWSSRYVSVALDRILLPQVPQDPALLRGFQDQVNQLMYKNGSVLDSSELLTHEAVAEVQAGLQMFAAMHARKRLANVLCRAKRLLVDRNTNTVRGSMNSDLVGCMLGDNSPSNKGKPQSIDVGPAKELTTSDLFENWIDQQCLSLNQPPSYLVTVQTQSFIDMLKGVILSGGPSAQVNHETSTIDQLGLDTVESYAHARDLISFWIATVPLIRDQELKTSARAAALFRNDTEYLAHHLITVPKSFKSRIPPEISLPVSFMDLVPSILQAGTSVFKDMMISLRTQIHGYLLIFNDFVNVSLDHFSDKAQHSVDQFLQLLNELDMMWKGCLPDILYLRCIGLLANVYMVGISNLVITFPKLSTKTSYVMARIFQQVLTTINPMFELPSPLADNHEQNRSLSCTNNQAEVGPQIARSIAQHCLGYLKANAIFKLLTVESRSMGRKIVDQLAGLSSNEALQIIEKREF